MADTLKRGTYALPEPVSVNVTYEQIWSSNTGRNTAGKMVGDVVAEKVTLDITWGVLTEAEMTAIKNNLPSGFFALTYKGKTYTGYRGEIKSDVLDINNGVAIYKSATVQFIEQ